MSASRLAGRHVHCRTGLSVGVLIPCGCVQLERDAERQARKEAKKAEKAVQHEADKAAKAAEREA